MRSYFILISIFVTLLTVVSCGSDDQSTTNTDTDPDVTEFINLIGTWERVHKSGRYEYIFREDGTYTKNAYDEGTYDPIQTTNGRFSVKQGFMTLTVFATDGSNTELARQSKPYVLLENTWYPDQVYLHSLPGSALEEGLWSLLEENYTYKTGVAELSLDSTREDTLTFSADGTYQYDAQLKDENGKLIPNPSTGGATVDIHLSGTFFVEDGMVYAQDEQADRAFGIAGDRLYHDDNSWRYERIK